MPGRQQNFRLSDEVIAGVEAVVPARGEKFDPAVHRARDKSDAVRLALEFWLDGGADGDPLLRRPLEVNMGSGPTSGGDGRRIVWPEDPERWSRVDNAAGTGTLLRPEHLDRFRVGDLCRVKRTREAFRVLEVDTGEGLLCVQREVLGHASAIRSGDAICVMERASEASPAGEGAADRAGSPGEESTGSPFPAVQGGEGAGSAPSAVGGRAGDIIPAVPVPPGNPVAVDQVLAERLGKPAAVIRRWVADGRVTVGGEPLAATSVDGRAFVAGAALTMLELDGERV